jgi:2-hydroxychromene-2-carboxylate isomerase
MAAAEIEFFYDIGSSYSYLAATQVEGLAARTGAKVRHRPFLLGGLFKAIGSGPPATLAPKASYMLRDLQRWARLYGVSIRVPSSFPANTLRAQRVLAAAELDEPAKLPAVTLAFFHAHWVDDRDIADAAVLAEVASAAGARGEELVRASEEPRVKERLRASTEEVQRRGAFGAPTFFVGDEMFFGNDRLAHVESFARGEGPRATQASNT